jgi:molybdopterin-containing oxidoreductase family membrane subunit
MITAKRILYVVGIIALLLGLYGFFSRLVYGERDVNYGSYVNWGLWVAMYLFFAGMAAGSFMVATLDYLFKVPLFRGTGKFALLGSLVTLPLALVLIGFDLGHMERIWKVYLQPNFESLLAQLVWSYSLLLIVVIAALLIARRSEGTGLRITMGIGLVLAVFVSGAVGALLGTNVSRASLHTALLPVQFPILNIASGVALMLIFVGFFKIVRDEQQRSRLMRVLSVALIVLVLAKAYFLWVDYSQALYSGAPDTVEATNMVLFGTWGWAFWVLQVGLGILLPVLVLLQPSWAKNGLVAGLMAALVLLGLAVGRTAIIFPAMAIPEIQGLAEAFTGPHLNYDYVPSLMEWSVVLGVVGISMLAFLLAVDRLPFFGATPRPTQTTGRGVRTLEQAPEVTR